DLGRRPGSGGPGPAPGEVAPAPVTPSSAESGTAPSADRAPTAVVRAAPRPGASEAEIELIALEEAALRRIDVVPVLEAAGVDVHALKARADAADILRHVAADELM